MILIGRRNENKDQEAIQICCVRMYKQFGITLSCLNSQSPSHWLSWLQNFPEIPTHFVTLLKGTPAGRPARRTAGSGLQLCGCCFRCAQILWLLAVSDYIGHRQVIELHVATVGVVCNLKSSRRRRRRPGQLTVRWHAAKPRAVLRFCGISVLL